MKATLEFNLPEEQQEHQTALVAPRLKGIIWDLLQELRRRRKYKDEQTVDIEEVEKYIFELFEKESLDPDELF